MRHLVDRHRAAEDARVAAEPAHPVGVTEDHDAVGRRAAFIARLYHAPDDRPDAQNVEVVARYLLPGDRIGLAVDQHSHRRCRVDLEGTRDRLRVDLQMFVERVRGTLGCPAVPPVQHLEECRRIANGKRAQHQRIENTEDGRVRADPEREGQHRSGGEGRSPPEAPDAVPKILSQPFPPYPHGHLPHVFHHVRRITEGFQRRAPSIVG